MKDFSVRAKIRWLTWGLILTALFAAYCCYKYVSFYRYANSQRRAFAPKFDRHKLFERLSADTSDIVFVGNSLTQHFELAEILKNPHVRNRGIGGDSISGVLARLPTIIAGRPSKVFIEIGINDLSAGKAVKEIRRDYAAIIAHIRQQSPATQVYVQSVLPVGTSAERIVCREGCNDSVRMLNSALRAMADSAQVRYIDLYESFADGRGGLRDSLQNDGLHLSGSGYLLWARIVRRYVEE